MSPATQNVTMSKQDSPQMSLINAEKNPRDNREAAPQALNTCIPKNYYCNSFEKKKKDFLTVAF